MTHQGPATNRIDRSPTDEFMTSRDGISSITWKTVAQRSASIFQNGRGQDYLQPGSLTAILHKILDETQHTQGTATRNQAERPRS